MSRTSTERRVTVAGIRISVDGDHGDEAGHAYVYFPKNDGHAEPEAYLVDVYVEPAYRKHGIGRALTKLAIEAARREGAYKLVATSRSARTHVHALYLSEGFAEWGKEFRIDFVP